MRGKYGTKGYRRNEGMPRSGYKTITVPEDLHKSIEELAKQKKKTIPKQLECMVKNEKARKD